MPLSNLSSLSLAYRSSVGRLRQPAFSVVFSIPKHASSIHPPPPPPTPNSVAHSRHMHSYNPQRQRPKIESDWAMGKSESLNREKESMRLSDWNSEQREALFKMKTAAQSTDVALSMAKRLLQDEGKKSNVVFSPLLIHVMLSLVACGSSGATRDELLRFLKSNTIEELNHSASQLVSIVLADGSHCGGPRFAFATGVWVDQTLSLKDSFKHLIDTTYKATLRQANFKTKGNEVVSEVNSWVSTHTKGLITNILSPESINIITDIILANALYFHGTWKNKFNPYNTKHREFYLLDGTSIRVPFMTSDENQYIAAYHDAGFKVLRMLYKRGRDARQFSMLIFLPDGKDGLRSLIEKIDTQPGFIDRHIPEKKVKVGKFMIPKFKFCFDVEFSEVLQKLGLVSPFVGGGGVLSEMVDSSSSSSDYFISKIFHKSIIEVNEKGTKAVAAVILGFGAGLPRMMINSHIDFVADHPFLFAIREDVTGTLLFVGQVRNPNC